MRKIKLLLFGIFRKVCDFLRYTDMHKIIPYRSSLYNILFQVNWPYTDVIEIQGSKMYINFHDERPAMRETFKNYALNLVHEEATTDLFKRVVEEGDIVIDLGANIGYFTLLAAKLVKEKGKVYAFEPEPKNYGYLVKNIGLNGYNNVFAIPRAVSNETGKIKLYICPYDTGHHTIKQYDGIRAYRPELGLADETEKALVVETTTLDDFLKEESVDVIKMDLEGAEMLALLGMDNVIRRSKKLKMFVEFFPLLLRKMGNSPEEFIWKLIGNYQFSIFVIGGDYSMHSHSLNKGYLKINSVEELMAFCKDEGDHLNLFMQRGFNSKGL